MGLGSQRGFEGEEGKGSDEDAEDERRWKRKYETLCKETTPPAISVCPGRARPR